MADEAFFSTVVWNPSAASHQRSALLRLPKSLPTVGGGATRGSAVTAKTIDEVRSTSPRADCEASSLVPRDVCTMKRDGSCFERDGDANSDSEA